MRKPLRLPAVVSGEVDLAISMFRVTPEAAAQVAFSTPYYDSALAALTLPGMSPASLAALNGKRLALIERNDAGGSELPAGVTPASTMRFGRFERAAEALKAGEVDALLSERANIESFIKDGHPEFVCSEPLLRTPIAVALPKGNPDLLREVNAAIEALKASGKAKEEQTLDTHPPLDDRLKRLPKDPRPGAPTAEPATPDSSASARPDLRACSSSIFSSTVPLATSL
jgi:ABC-type amino acid transport substrate-binding protein